MTNERRQDIVLIALVLSIGVHIAAMFLARPLVMSHATKGVPRSVRRAPMQVTESTELPDPVKLQEVLDLAPLKDAPAAKNVELPSIGSAVDVPPPTPTEIAKPEDPVDLAAPDEPAAVFESASIRLDEIVSEKINLGGIDAPKPTRVLAAPAAAPAMAKVGDVPEIAIAPSLPEAPPAPNVTITKVETIEEQKDEPKAEFKPAEEVLEKVDEKVVEQEKVAVRELVNAENAVELVKFVNLTMVAATEGKWTYFKIAALPRRNLETVPKDVVVLIDASGSIGGDRMGSIRGAAKKILRSATNSGDRFNLVAFRDRFTYAFRSWQPCTQWAFDKSDKWLNNVAAHGRTDVFSTISSVLTLPRDPTRPLIALVVTDGDANSGVSDTAEILSRFTELNDGLISVYMYGVKSSANRELIDVLTHGNRGESFIFNGWRWNAGEGIEGLSERFRDPVLSDIRLVFASNSPAEAYPQRLKNLYRGEVLEIYGRVPAGTKEVAFSIKGLNGKTAYEGFFSLPLATAPADSTVISQWKSEQAIDRKLTAKR